MPARADDREFTSLSAAAKHRVSADIGGSFTDIALLSPEGILATRKLLSTPANYADAVITGITELMAELDLPTIIERRA